MTKFITYYNLCPIHDPKEFLGISADRDEGNVITTLSKNVVVVIKISTQKQIRSWSVLEKLSTKVVYDRRSKKYVGVFANRALRCWDEKTADVNKAKKLKFQKAIAELVSVGDDTLVLYMDGSCELLATAIESRKEEVLTGIQQLDISVGKQLLNASVMNVHSDGSQILTYFERQRDTQELQLVCLKLEDGKKKYFPVKRGNLDVHVAGFAVIEGNDAPMLLTIWSDKRIFLLSLHESAEPERSPGNFVSMISALKVDSPLSLLGISRHFVAIYGANSGQEGASLLLYNTQFKVVKAKQFFKVYFDFSQLWAANEHILLAMGQNLSVVSYRMSKELLAELVGTQANNDFQTPIEGDHINEEEALQEYMQFSNAICDDNPNTTLADSYEEMKPVEANGKCVPFESVDNFEHALNQLTQMHMHVEVIEDECSLEDESISLMSNFNDTGFSTREIQMIACQLERCGASEHEITEKLLTVLIKAGLLQDIAVCLRRYTNISEKMLAKTLSYVLSNFKSTISEIATENQTSTTNGEQHTQEINAAEREIIDTAEFPNINLLASKHQHIAIVASEADILNIVLSCSFDPNAIAVHIRREIDYHKVILLLQHLYNVLTREEVTFEERPASSAPQCAELELQALRWFGVFLNTHFQKLALSRDANLMELLYKWHELFLLYKREIVELEQTAALLYNIVQRKKICKDKNSSKWYSIEEVILY